MIHLNQFKQAIQNQADNNHIFVDQSGQLNLQKQNTFNRMIRWIQTKFGLLSKRVRQQEMMAYGSFLTAIRTDDHYNISSSLEQDLDKAMRHKKPLSVKRVRQAINQFEAATQQSEKIQGQDQQQYYVHDKNEVVAKMVSDHTLTGYFARTLKQKVQADSELKQAKFKPTADEWKALSQKTYDRVLSAAKVKEQSDEPALHITEGNRIANEVADQFLSEKKGSLSQSGGH